MNTSEYVQQFVNWLTVGGIYALLALGVAVVFSILGLINLAHGELVVISGYAMVWMLARGLSWVLVIPLSVMVAMLAAVGMERIVFRPMRGSSTAALVLGSLALSIVIQNAFVLFVGARPEPIAVPTWTQSTFTVLDVRVRWLDIATWIVTALVLISVVLFLRRSVRGLALRAAAEDFEVTRLMGIGANSVIRGAFALSGFLAGVAALFFLATASLVGPSSGFNPLLKGFIAAVIGGLASLPGAVLGGFVLAGIEILSQLYLPDSIQPYSDAIVFGIVIVVLFFRPQGLLVSRSSKAVRV